MADRNKIIKDKFKKHLDYLLNNTEYEVACLMLQGSQNYGLDEYTDNYQSDVDTKAIVIPSFKDIAYNKPPVSTTIVLDNNEHIDVKDIRVMFDTIKKANVSYIELLYTCCYWINPLYEEFIKKLFDNRDLIASYNVDQFVRCIAGMSMEKRKALCHPYPNLIEKINKYGYDGKQLSHCIRLFEFLERFMCGTTLEECYKTCIPEKLMNYKKQLTEDGLRVLTVEEAVELCDRVDAATRNLKEAFLLTQHPVKSEAAELLNEVKYEVMKKKFLLDFVEEATIDKN